MTSSLKRARRGASALTALAVTAAGLTGVTLASAPAHAAPVPVTDVEFVWDINDETTAGAFAPGTWNLMSAGRIGNPGEGYQALNSADGGATWSNGATAGWSGSAGNVTVEARQEDGSYAPATFVDTRPEPLNSSQRAENRARFAEGSGVVDPDAGTAEISWEGDLTVLFYSGYTFFHLSDPALSVASDGTGELTATLSGYGADMEDPDVWVPVAPQQVTVATLAGVDVTEDGIEATPTYLGVEYDAPAGATPQNRTGQQWGSFPQEFVDFQQDTGTGPYWYSTGGAADSRKPANPLTVSYSLPDAPAPAPTVAVSATEFTDGEHEVTVTGTGFDPAMATGTRPPLLGQPAGVYVVFGKFAESWRPSEGAPGSTRVNSDQKWAVKQEHMMLIGGPSNGAVELTPEGTFSATLTVDKDAIDAKTAGNDALVNYGIYTYAGSGAAQGAYETATPITFAATEPTAVELSVSTPKRRYGDVRVQVAVNAAEGNPAGRVRLFQGDRQLRAGDLDGGVARFRFSRLGAGQHTLRAVYDGNDEFGVAEESHQFRVLRSETRVNRKLVQRPQMRQHGRLRVRVVSPTAGGVAGPVRVVIRKGNGELVAKRQKRTNGNGVTHFRLPPGARGGKGQYRVRIVHLGTPNTQKSNRQVRYRLR